MSKPSLKTLLFWLALIGIGLGGTYFAKTYFNTAFPIVNVDITMTRKDALKAAHTRATQFKLGPSQAKRIAAFDFDRDVRNFIEIEKGGHEAFIALIRSGQYAPYTWLVRHYRENDPNETYYQFKPDGTPYGFKERISDKTPGPALSRPQALDIARTSAKTNWGISFKDYTLIESSSKTVASGRKDHRFVFEHRHPVIPETSVRLTLGLSGDQFTELHHSIKIPETFTRKYAKMRSGNNTISTVATIAVGILYLLVGCIGGLFYLSKKRSILWKKAAIWAGIISGLAMVSAASESPLIWFQYDTALSSNTFLLRHILSELINTLNMGVIIFLSFVAAEGLTRAAFPEHLQFWKLWRTDTARSRSVIGQSIGGYLLIGFDLAFVVATYLLTSKLFGWWTPSSALINPNILATHLPWITPITNALRAGFWEECLFRAVPIAGAALIGQRFGKRNLFIVGALVLQAIIFGAAHANYPSQPSYARLLELIIPSLVYGFVYIRYGLLPAIISHFGYDVVLMSIPIFTTQSSQLWDDKVLVIALALIPIWIVLYAWKASSKTSLPLNKAWAPPSKPKSTRSSTAFTPTPMSRSTIILAPILGVIGLVLWWSSAPLTSEAPVLSLSRHNAIQIAKETLIRQGVDASKWTPLAKVSSAIPKENRFIWQTEPRATYTQLLSNFLSVPHWTIRWVNLDRDITERAEEYVVVLSNSGKIERVRHILPESRPGTSLSRSAARNLVFSTLKSRYGLSPSDSKVISATPTKQPKRRDWKWVIQDTRTQLNSDGQTRYQVTLSGNQITDISSFIHIPEKWTRAETNKDSLYVTVTRYSKLMILVLYAFAAMVGLLKWSKGQFNIRAFWNTTALLGGAYLISAANNWPIKTFALQTASPVLNQLIISYGLYGLKTLFFTITIATVVGFASYWKPPQYTQEQSRSILIGVGAALLIEGILTAITKSIPNKVPIIAKYEALSTWVPLFTPSLDLIPRYVGSTALIAILLIGLHRMSKGYTERKGLTFCAFVGVGFLFASMQPLSPNPYFSTGVWLTSWVAYSAVLIISYITIFRHEIRLIPITTATLVALSCIQQIAMDSYPESAISYACAATVVLIIGFGGFKLLSDSNA